MDEIEITGRDRLALQRKWAWRLGLAGLLPFLACALVVVAFGADNALTSPAIEIFRYYSVVILSFLGGIRWGHAIRQDTGGSLVEVMPLFWSVVPSLAGFATMFLEAEPAIGILLIAFCAQGAWDSFSANAGKLPAWFAPLRMVLTASVAAAHIAVFFVLLQR